MKNEEGKFRFANKIRLAVAMAAIVVVIAILAEPFSDQKAAAVTDPLAKINQRPAPIFDLNETSVKCGPSLRWSALYSSEKFVTSTPKRPLLS